MEVLSFHIKGKMAHFRKYYSNSSALSYTIPPRTVICGILAGILGMERDSYYEMFSMNNCDIAVGLFSPVKKTVQKMNLLMIKSSKDLNGSQENHSQCPTEFVIPHDIKTGEIDYKIWVSHKDSEIMNSLKQRFENLKPCYKSLGISVALGSAQNIGWIEYAGIYNASEIEAEGDFVELHSAVSVEQIEKLDLSSQQGYFLVKEELPAEFDSNRRLTDRGKKEVIINKTGNPVKAKLRSYTSLENGENIVWMN